MTSRAHEQTFARDNFSTEKLPRLWRIIFGQILSRILWLVEESPLLTINIRANINDNRQLVMDNLLV